VAAPPEPVPAQPETPPEVWTDETLRTHDFTGWEWNNLPFQVVKSARNGGSNVITARIECVNCKRAIWTCNPKLEDLCEECDYFLRSRNWELIGARNKKNARRTYNPFSDEPREITRAFWPKDEF